MSAVVEEGGHEVASTATLITTAPLRFGYLPMKPFTHPCVLVIAALFASIIAPASPIGAQTREDQRDEEARRLFQAAELAFADARYEDALDLFERSYALSQRPQLLFNIGTSADRLRLDARALSAFEDYLERLPDASNRREVEVRIGVLRRAVSRPAAPGPVIDTPPHDANDSGDASGATTGRPIDFSADEPTSEARRPRRWPWVLLSVVLVGAAASLAIVLTRPPTQHWVTGDIGPGGVVFALGGDR